MGALMKTSRKTGGRLRLGLACALALALSACSPSGDRRMGAPAPRASAGAIETAPLPAAGDLSRFGTGPFKIALIAPITGPAGANAIGASMRNAAELAMSAFDSPAATLIVKDDRSSPAGARAAAQAAIAEGAQLILGPLFSANVREAGAAARAAGKPMIAFSTDPALAGNGVYLLSFLTRSYVDRIVDFAAARGKRSMAALVPDSDYGRIAEAAFIAAAARNNVRVAAVERRSAGGPADAAAQRIANLGAGIDALFIPDQAEAMAEVAQALARAGIDAAKVQILGTGLWNDARVLKIRALQGAWFAAPDSAGYMAFAASHRERFGVEPARVATLAYDAVALSLALANQPGEGFTARALEGVSGFNGTDGLFRFRPDGLNERGLTVQMIDQGATTLISPAPKTF